MKLRSMIQIQYDGKTTFSFIMPPPLIGGA